MNKVPCRMYLPPNGLSEMGTISNIYDDDAKWIIDNNYKVSMEELSTGHIGCYLDVGLKDEDGEPLEAIEISLGRSCEETLRALCLQAKEMLK